MTQSKFKVKIKDPYDFRTVTVNSKKIDRELSTGIRRVFKCGKYVIKIEDVIENYDACGQSFYQCKTEFKRWNKKIKKSSFKRYFVPTLAFGKLEIDDREFHYCIQPFLKGSNSSEKALHFLEMKAMDRAYDIFEEMNLSTEDIKPENMLCTGKHKFKIIDYGV
jgi:hypothetical protein